jgi:adenosine kinase
MSALVCGSLAFDSIATFGGRFADQIMPNQLHVLNVSFLVPTLRREFGGCAGNIAYNLAALGGEPVVVAAVGADGADYLARLRSWGASTSTTTRSPRSIPAPCSRRT